MWLGPSRSKEESCPRGRGAEIPDEVRSSASSNARAKNRSVTKLNWPSKWLKQVTQSSAISQLGWGKASQTEVPEPPLIGKGPCCSAPAACCHAVVLDQVTSSSNFCEIQIFIETFSLLNIKTDSKTIRNCWLNTSAAGSSSQAAKLQRLSF